jgi:hypothetical protein
MRRPAALFPIVLALGAIILAPRAGAQAQDAREEGPTEIKKCQTISQQGSYKLVNNLTFTGTTGTCLTITASSVTIDLAGFTISGRGFPFAGALTAAGAGIAAANDTMGIAVRNGSIAGFSVGVALDGDGSLVEGLRVFGSGCPPCDTGISATGIVRGNTVVGIFGFSGHGTGIFATGIITGNYVTRSRVGNLEIDQGSTVIGNTVTDTFPGIGLSVACPSNVTDNTVVGNGMANLVLGGNGCNNTNNVAP